MCVCVCVCFLFHVLCLAVLFAPVTRALASINLLANWSYIAAPATSRYPSSYTMFDEWTINVRNIPAPPLLTLILFKILRWTSTLFRLESFPCTTLNDLLKLAFLFICASRLDQSSQRGDSDSCQEAEMDPEMEQLPSGIRFVPSCHLYYSWLSMHIYWHTTRVDTQAQHTHTCTHTQTRHLMVMLIVGVKPVTSLLRWRESMSNDI